MGHGENQKGGESQPQQQQPPRCLVRLFLARHEFEKQPERRKPDMLRLGRREAQEPPNDRKCCNRGKRPGGEKGEALKHQKVLA